MKIQSYFISGAGNKFLICFIQENQRDEVSSFSKEVKKSFLKKVCLDTQSDGFIFLSRNETDLNYSWEFYNNDGSDAEMCGNATRCVGFFVQNILKDTRPFWQLLTVAGLIEISSAAQNSTDYKVVMTPIQQLSSSLGFFCDTGVPHLILEIADFADYLKHKEQARALRKHSDFGPKGTNVTFVTFLSPNNKVQAVSFERGVEDFTAACGTGAMAAAFYNLIKRGSVQTEVEMPGGTLIMNLTNLQRPTMTGPTVLIGKYEYELKV